MNAIKSDSDSDSHEQKKVARFFRKKNRRVTPSVAAPGVTHPSDATGIVYTAYPRKGRPSPYHGHFRMQIADMAAVRICLNRRTVHIY